VIKQALHKIFSVVLSLLVLLSTLSFSIDKHYCGNTLIDTAIFKKAKTCGMEMDSSQKTSLKKSCCKDVVEIIKGQNELKLTSVDNLKFHQQLFINSFVYSYFDLFESLPKQVIPHKDYSPPNLVANIQVLDQVFII
jgi:hypothetical protein